MAIVEEVLRQYPVPTFPQAQEIVDGYIAFYNYERIQLKTKQTPYQIRCLFK
jgi:putative transposase